MSQAAVYLALILSCLFLPSLVIKRLTCKWTMMVCTLLYSVYMAAQFYPRVFTMIPAAVVLGLAAAPMWSAKCTYLTQVSDSGRPGSDVPCLCCRDIVSGAGLGGHTMAYMLTKWHEW